MHAKIRHVKKLEGKWLAAVSAGPDSMALLCMCLEAGMMPGIVHVNYHHQKQAEEEEQYLRQFASEHHLSIYVKNDPFAWKGNFEAAARKYRYDFFAETAEKYRYDGVLVAHQMDDVLETYLMQKERNLVPACYGLAEEMRYHGMIVKRPLLSYTRKDILAYCEKDHIRYYLDETNEDLSYARNRIRKEVEKMDEQARGTLLAEIDYENQKLSLQRQEAARLIHNDKILIEDYRHAEESARLLALRSLIDEHAALGHLKEIDHILLTRDDFDMPVKGQRLAISQGAVFLTDPAEPYSCTFSRLEEILAFPGNKSFQIAEGKKGTQSVTVSEADFPVTIRNWQPGDAIKMRFGTKSVHRFFIDRHIPLYNRKSWPVVVNQKGTVILVPGLGCDAAHWSISPSFSVLQYSASDGGKPCSLTAI